MSTIETSAQTSRTFTIDAAHSTAAFLVRHMMISKVRGHFNAINGTIELPATGNVPIRVEASIDAASVDTREPQRDAHLKSADFFDVDAHPQLTFRSTKIEGNESAFRISGELTIHGTTRSVTFDATFEGAGRDPWGHQRVGYEARAQISRKDFGLTWNQTLETGGLLVSDDVQIELTIEAIAKNA